MPDRRSHNGVVEKGGGGSTSRYLRYDYLYKALSATPAILWQFLFMVLPVIIMIEISFWRADPWTLKLIPDFTLKNYIDFFSSQAYVSLLIKTLKISAISVMLIVLVSYPLAYYISFGVQNKSRQLFLLLTLFLPFWTSYLVRTFAWVTILGRGGLVNSFLMYLNIITEPTPLLLFTENTTILGIVYVWLPFGILPIYAAMDGIDRSVIEASMDLGAGRLRTFVHITLPLSMSGILAAVVILFIPIAGSYVEPTLLGGPSGAMISVTLLRQYGAAFNWPFGNAMSLILLGVTSVVILVFSKLVRIEKILRF